MTRNLLEINKNKRKEAKRPILNFYSKIVSYIKMVLK